MRVQELMSSEEEKRKTKQKAVKIVLKYIFAFIYVKFVLEIGT